MNFTHLNVPMIFASNPSNIKYQWLSPFVPLDFTTRALGSDSLSMDPQLWLYVAIILPLILIFHLFKPRFQPLVLSLVKLGPIPRSVGFIMDGNRRYARTQSIETSIGHLRGFNTLEETLHWCMDLGVESVTVYAFSIENFRRSAKEVDALMRLAKEKMIKLAEHQYVYSLRLYFGMWELISLMIH